MFSYLVAKDFFLQQTAKSLGKLGGYQKWSEASLKHINIM